MADNRINFEDQKISVTLGVGMAEISVGDRKINTTYDQDIKYIDLSKKMTRLVEEETKKRSNPLQSLFAFGDTFCMSMVSVLKGRA